MKNGAGGLEWSVERDQEGERGNRGMVFAMVDFCALPLPFVAVGKFFVETFFAGCDS